MGGDKAGTEVTARDLETGESETKVIRDDWVVITDGAYRLDGVQAYGNGTVVVTLKRETRSAADAPAVPGAER